MNKRGRPRGSRNRTYETIREFGTECPNQQCRSTDLRPIDGRAPTLALDHGVDPESDRVYTHVERLYRRCHHCGQACILRRLHYNPEADPANDDPTTATDPQSSPG